MISGEMLFMAATNTRNAKGVHSQTLATMMAAMAVFTSESQAWTGRWSEDAKNCTMPMFGSYM